MPSYIVHPWFLCTQHSCIEKQKRYKLAQMLDVMSMLPLAVSGLWSELVSCWVSENMARTFQFLWLTCVAHAMLTTPFVIRILLPAMREIDSDYEAMGMVLGCNSTQRFSKLKSRY